MTQAISALELALMDRKFKRMQREDALRSYRRKNAAAAGINAVPGQHPASAKAQVLIKQMKAHDVALRQRALDALTEAPETESPLAGLSDRLRDGLAALVTDEETPTPTPAKPEKHVITRQGGKAYLMAVSEVDGEIIFATVVSPTGQKVRGTPMTRLNWGNNRKSIELFGSLADALSFVRTNGIALVG